MVRFIITILLQGTRLTPEFSINIKAFFCFSEKHRMEYYETRFLLMKPLHVNLHRIRLREYLSTNFTTIWFLLKHICFKMLNSLALILTHLCMRSLMNYSLSSSSETFIALLTRVGLGA